MGALFLSSVLKNDKKKHNKKTKKTLTKSCKRGILLLVHQRNIFEANKRTLAIK